MRICIDLDGTICTLRQEHETYADVQVLPGARERISQLKKEGHYIIIYTARHSKTCEGNVGKIIARQGATTLKWLEDNGIEYDEIHFGKPYANLYIDDLAQQFKSWDQVEI